MVCQKQFHRDAADIADLRGRGLHLQSGLGRRGTCALDSAPFDLHKAEAACAVHTEFGVIAEGGQVDLGLADEFEQVALSLDRYGSSIDRQSWLRERIHLAISLQLRESCRLLRTHRT